MSQYTQSIRGDIDGPVRQYEYADSNMIVADFGAVNGSVDVVDETAMVVIDDEQYEFAVPEGVASAVMNNGIVTVEVE